MAQWSRRFPPGRTNLARARRTVPPRRAKTGCRAPPGRQAVGPAPGFHPGTSPPELEKTVKDIRKALALTVAAGALVLGSAGVANADASAVGTATNSPGVLSGNVVQIPI